MSVHDALRRFAQRFVQEAQDREFKAKENYERIEAQLRKARSEYESATDLASGAAERAANFVPMLGSDFQCARCWVCDEKNSALRPLHGDPLECVVCGQEYPV